MKLSNLDKVNSNIRDLIGEMSAIVNDDSLSKGMKVSELDKLKGRLATVNASFEDMIKTERLTNTINGTIKLNVLTSKNHTRYQVDGYEHLFVISESFRLVTPKDCTGRVNEAPAETELYYDLCLMPALSDANFSVSSKSSDILNVLVSAFCICIENHEVTLDELTEAFKNTTLIERITKQCQK